MTAWRQRARPLFGAYVRISAAGMAEAALDAAMSRAFAVGQRIHDAMSRQDPLSDVSRIGEAPAGRPVAVQRDTLHVLDFALDMARATNGLFDPVAPVDGRRAASWQDLSFTSDGMVVAARRLSVSLDGVAKGYGADMMVRSLVEAGATDVVVDAGGDVALHCRAPREIAIRNPRLPGYPAGVVLLAQGGVASSGDYGGISNLWRPDGSGVARPRAVTISAPDCMTADALTKVVALIDDSAFILRRWNAQAFYPESPP